MKKKIIALLLAAAMLLSCAPAFLAARIEKKKGLVLPTGGSYAEDELVDAIVLLSGAPAADCAARGTEKMSGKIRQLSNEQAAVQKKMAQKGLSFRVDFSYRALLNGFSVTVPYGQLDEIAGIDGVSQVHISNRYAVSEEPAGELSANEMTGADFCHVAGYDGTGSVIAILDTGLNTTHEAFRDYGNTEKVITRETLRNTETPGRYLSVKVPFAYDYADRDNDVTDVHGHGTHVAGIAGGCALAEDGTVAFSGAAPGAQLLIMKVVRDGYTGTSSSIYFAALEDAYLLGADVVNMSVGVHNGFSYDASLENDVFGHIYNRLEKAGIVVCAAAGNDYSMGTFTRNSLGYGVLASYADYGVVSSPSTVGNNISVASAESKNYLTYTIEVDGKSAAYTDKTPGEAFRTSFCGQTVPYVIVPDSGARSDYEGLDVRGKIAVVTRGEISFDDVVLYAGEKGAVAVIVCNNIPGVFSVSVDKGDIPAISVTQSVGKLLANATEKTLFVPAEAVMIENPDGGKMSEFSSWGTTSDLRLKPAITAVGGYVCSASCSGDTDYCLKSGTSMAAPNAAGCYAVVLQAIRQADPDISKPDAAAMANAVLESTAQIVTQGEVPYSPRKQGAGLIDLKNAINTAVYLANPMQELGDDPDRSGTYSFSLTVKRPFAECDAHEYVQTAVSPASCFRNGCAEFVCVICHDSYAEPISAFGHDYRTTHTDGDYRFLTCENCGNSYREALGAEDCPASGFEDVDLDQWYHEGVDYAVLNGLFQGIAEDQFAPDGEMTRAMLVTVLYRMEGKPVVEELENPFTDLSESWYTDAVIWAAGNNIVKGVGEGLFDPNGVLSREQLAAIVYRYSGGETAQQGNLASLNGFKDADRVSAWAQSAVQWAVSTSLLQGVGDNCLDPLGNTTRGQVATILMRYINLRNGEKAASRGLASPQQSAAAVYGVDVTALVDIAESYSGVTYNTTRQKRADIEWSVRCDGELLRNNLLRFESWETEKTVELTLSLGDSTRSYLDKSFENGAFVDGFVTLTQVGGEDAIHATFLAFYGDWAQGDILAPYDFADMLRALDTVYEESESGGMIRDVYDINEMDVDYNLAYIGGQNSYHCLGSNPYSSELRVPYDASYNYVSNAESGCDKPGLSICPAQLRNARHLIMTVSDRKTGTLYSYTDREYVGKAYYDNDECRWQSPGSFLWSGDDLNGKRVPDGTELTVRVYACLDYGEDVLGTIAPEDLIIDGRAYLQWSFDVTVDSAAPVIEACSYDPVTRGLTVAVRDNHALAYVGALDANRDSFVDLTAGSGRENETYTYTLDLSDYEGDIIYLEVEDYASNFATVKISLIK